MGGRLRSGGPPPPSPRRATVRPASSASVWVTARCTAVGDVAAVVAQTGRRSPPARATRRRASGRRAARARRAPRGPRPRRSTRRRRPRRAGVTTAGHVSHRSTTSMSTRRSGSPSACSPAASTVWRTRAVADGEVQAEPGRHRERDVGGRVRPRLLDAAAAGAHPVHGVDDGAQHRRRRRAGQPVGPERRVQPQRLLGPQLGAHRAHHPAQHGLQRRRGQLDRLAAMRCTVASSRRASA